MEESIATQRGKRQKVDKHGRLSAFEKLKQLKGTKNKYAVDEMENVYDTVDETEYSERVLRRQDDDWIEDDGGGGGYVEDGREIFDDDEIEDSYVVSKESGRGQKRKARLAAQPSGKGNIRNLLGAMPSKKKEETKISDDNILSDIISDLDSSAASTAVKPKPLTVTKANVVESNKRDAQNYFKNLSANVKKTTTTAASFIKENTPVVKEEKKIQEKPKENGVSKAIPEPKQTDKPTTKKTEWKIDKEIKQELEDSATQNIEEFQTQDIDFDDDFSNDAVAAIKTPVKAEPSIPSSSNTITDVAEEFLNDEFDIFSTKKQSPKELKPLSSNWSDQMGDNQVAALVQVDSTQLPLQTNENGEKVLKFYWLDAWEDKFVKPGVVYLFGKVYANASNKKAGCVSCCLVVKNVNRKLYLLPREYKLDAVTLEATDEEVSMMDVYEEFNSSVAAELGLKEFKSRKVTRSYAFNLPDIPAMSDYLEVKYAATFPPPPTNKKYRTFSHVFGANASSLETFLLERKIKGPCWLEVRAPENVQAKVSWCKMEAASDKMENISVIRSGADLEPPPVVMATINMRTTMDTKTKKTKILMLSCLVHNNFPIHKPPPNPPFQQHFCVMTKCNEIWPLDLKQALPQFKATKLTKCDSERELLNYFMVQFWKLDADLVVGHDLQGFQQDLLIGNILDLRIPNWSRLGRLKRSVAPPRKYAAKDAFLGRLVCDIKLSAMELIRARSFDLDTLCVNVLKMKEGERTDIGIEDLPRYYENSRDLLQLVSLSMQDTSYILKIMCELSVIPLALQITQIAGNVMSRTLMGGRSERNEFLLLHAFTEKDYIVPDKVYGKKAAVEEDNEDEENPGGNVSKKQAAKKKAAYSGGLVLDPKKGFYDKLILLMDFNSLYPSIIQEYNICFTTIKRKSTSASDDDISNLVLPTSNVEFGVLPTQIRKLVESRREVKKLIKTPDLAPEQYMQYNIRQMALKLTANSMYGCLGFTHSRFYAKPLAALVTMKGREILMDTKEIVHKSNYEVVYGDTDSLMINTNCLDYDSVFKIGNDLKREINKKYRQIELDIDGVFRYLLLLKKKKYAAVLISKNKSGDFVFTQEHKGLDIVRRDWSQLAAEAGKFILTQILSEQTPDERLESIQAHLNKLKDDLVNNKMPLSVLTITKQLTKNPNEYADKNLQPHVQVALRLNSKNSRRFKKGDIVPYIICEDGTANTATQRAYHLEELKNSENLKVDYKYYLAHQLHPVISRICEPIEGMDPARVADCLGLDPSGYKQITRKDNSNTETYEVENEQEKYRYCKEFVFVCVNDNCKTENRVRETFIKQESKEIVTFLEKCQNKACCIRPIDYFACVQNQLSLQVRQFHAQYYAGWVSCEDPACGHRTARLPQTFAGGHPLCRQCEKGVMFRDYTEKDLYYQLNFFLFLFDLQKQNTTKAKLHPQIVSAFQVLKEMIEDWLAHSAYSIISLSKLFRFFAVDSKNGDKVKTELPEIDILPETEYTDALMEMGTY